MTEQKIVPLEMTGEITWFREKIVDKNSGRTAISFTVTVTVTEPMLDRYRHRPPYMKSSLSKFSGLSNETMRETSKEKLLDEAARLRTLPRDDSQQWAVAQQDAVAITEYAGLMSEIRAERETIQQRISEYMALKTIGQSNVGALSRIPLAITLKQLTDFNLSLPTLNGINAQLRGEEIEEHNHEEATA